MDRKVKVRVKGLCGSNEPSRAAIPPSSSGVEFERMEKDAWVRFLWARVERILGVVGWWLREDMVSSSFSGASAHFFWILFSGIFLVAFGFLLKRFLNGFYSREFCADLRVSATFRSRIVRG